MSFFGSRRQVEPTAPYPSESERQQPSAPPAPRQVPGFETILGANCTMEGTLRSNENVRLDGTFTGTLEIAGNILVGETAKINADINAKNISIAGAVRGNITGKKVQLLRTGRIWGDIRAVALTTEEGAFIDGKITMMSPEAPVPTPPQIEAVIETHNAEVESVLADSETSDSDESGVMAEASDAPVENTVDAEETEPENYPESNSM